MYSGSFDYDIIIVGAGVSGLAAAHALHEKDSNLSFLILEGNDRIGGKVKSTLVNVGKPQKQPYDIGGQFICERQTHLIRLLRKLDIEMHENINDYGYTLGDFSESNFFKTSTMPPVFGDTAPAQDIMQFLGTLESMSSKVSLENPLTIDGYLDLDSTTMEAFMYSHLNYPLSRLYVRILVKLICGAEPSDVSVLFFLTYCNSTEGLTNTYLRSKAGGKGCWMKNTAFELCEKIAVRIGIDNVKTNCAVAAVTRNDFYVLVRTAEQEYKCQYLIMAIPPEQILKVNFYPSLNDARNTVLKRMRCKTSLKYIITYKRQFWREMDYNGDVYCYRNPREMFPIIVVYNISTDNNIVLTGLLDIDVHDTKKSYKNEVLTHLAIYFGKEALQPIDYVEKCWSGDDHIFEGFAVSFPPPKMMKTFHEIRRPIGRLYFAGAETATYWYGHMAGAAQAGFRAAVEVLYEIRPQCLTAQDFIDLKPRRKHLQFYTAEEDVLRNDWMVVLFITSIISYLLLKIITVFHYIMRMFTLRGH